MRRAALSVSQDESPFHSRPRIVTALALGLALGALHPSRPAHLSELGVLSEDGLLAPSVRLGGGA